ncbi:hypothetical protein CVT26_011746, partial [Gymnopilus dilepis]
MGDYIWEEVGGPAKFTDGRLHLGGSGWSVVEHLREQWQSGSAASKANTEDEVLKAAIAKYGKNQWARISSLLVRKTPKQCKARWYEWLDPSIKKTVVQDEKLLHLAKLMPTQWRTIAPIVGRTATQCLERYQKLLDEAEAKENEELGLAGPSGDSGPSAEDVRKLRPGEIDPDPETKPARPDPIDMDEDDKKMLSEARARLANTQGKKAKRKARERQLEEARRLAVLQKKRELKAAGIIMRHKTKKKGMDYNADIPFEKKPAPGSYDASEEQARIAAAPVGQTLRRLENKRKPEEEEAERKKRQRKKRQRRNAEAKEGEGAGHQTKFIAARDAQIQKLKEAEAIGRRRKLALSAAQVGEAELDDIVKIGQAGENAKALVRGGSDASNRLLSDYEGLEAARMARTPRTAPQQDNVMMEARNLRNVTLAQTPLLGDENTPLHAGPGGGSGFEGAMPRHHVAFTPNPLATPLRATPRDHPSRLNPAKRALKEGFKSLPKPENNFELLVPEEEDQDVSELHKGKMLEDAADRDEQIRRLREEEERKALARRSQSVQMGLPTPSVVNVSQLLQNMSLNSDDVDPDLAAAQGLVNEELADLLLHDSISHPLPGTTRPGTSQSSYTLPDDDVLAIAKNVIHLELATLVGFPSSTPTQLRDGLLKLSQAAANAGDISWASIKSRLVYDPSSKAFVDSSSLELEQRVSGYRVLLDECREVMAKEATKIGKLEKKLGITLGGYQQRVNLLSSLITAAFEEMQKAKLDYNSFSLLRANESAVGPQRVASLREEVETLEHKEKMLQMRYSELRKRNQRL